MKVAAFPSALLLSFQVLGTPPGWGWVHLAWNRLGRFHRSLVVLAVREEPSPYLQVCW